MRLLSLVLLLAFAAAARATPEARWQVAWNEVKWGGKGKLEFVVPGGRCDILTGEWAIEVDHVYKYKEGVRQCLHYARETGKKPGLALFVDHRRDTATKFARARRMAKRLKIRVWLINDDLDPKATFRLPPKAGPSSRDLAWVNVSTGSYHLPRCRYFEHSRRGRKTTRAAAVEHHFRPCTICVLGKRPSWWRNRKGRSRKGKRRSRRRKDKRRRRGRRGRSSRRSGYGKYWKRRNAVETDEERAEPRGETCAEHCGGACTGASRRR